MQKCFLCLIGVILLGDTSLAADKYSDPDSPNVQAAARAALAHAKVLDVGSRVLDIAGVSLGIEWVLKDLGAKVTAQEIRIELSADVLFDFDKYTLKPEASESLQKVGRVVAQYANSRLLVEGHTDSKGSHPYNMKLSENRATTVKKWLIDNANVQQSLITTRGWGETKSVAPNTKPDGSDNPEGRQKNRRVEITVRK
jgi:outer membrane protein OmpA-like peptidoglycan-associated protein